MIGTQGIFEQTYGYFEARMKFHSSPGEWSAFWLQSPTYGDPVGNPGQAGTETDIVEHRAVNPSGTDLRSRYVSAVHWDGYSTDHQQVAKTHGPLAGLGNDSWHTYGLKWSPSGYEFYFDDTLLWTVTQAVSRRSEYMILSSEVRDGNWAGNVPAGGYGSFASSVTNVQVDYVRVYAGVPGDFNGNGTVDAADYVVWRKGLATMYTQTDYDVWCCALRSAAAGSGASANIAVPEVTTAQLMYIVGMIGFCTAPMRGSVGKFQARHSDEANCPFSSRILYVALIVADADAAERPPNIVLIMADDLGLGEVGCYGGKAIPTPNIDRLAAEGLRFTNAYSASAVCAPTRCGLMTGFTWAMPPAVPTAVSMDIFRLHHKKSRLPSYSKWRVMPPADSESGGSATSAPLACPRNKGLTSSTATTTKPMLTITFLHF